MSEMAFAIMLALTGMGWFVVRRREHPAILLEMQQRFERERDLATATGRHDDERLYDALQEALYAAVGPLEGRTMPAHEARLARISLGRCTSPDFLHRHGLSHGTPHHARTLAAISRSLTKLEALERRCPD